MTYSRSCAMHENPVIWGAGTISVIVYKMKLHLTLKLKTTDLGQIASWKISTSTSVTTVYMSRTSNMKFIGKYKLR